MLDVLVVDDSDLIRKMILKTLRLSRVPLGAVYEAGNGREALELLEDNWIDLVLTDINMPVMDGMQLLGRMRESDMIAGVPVIVVSTESAGARMSELERMGVAGYVRKPFTPEKLRDVIAGVTSDWEESEHDRLVNEVFANVLERFTFMYGEPVPKDLLSEPEGDIILARITFSGSQGGAMTLAAPVSLCAEMAANILAEESESVPMPSAADALGEVLNMACGHMTSVLQRDGSIDLTPPVVTRMARDEWDTALSGSHSTGFLVEDRPVLLSLGVRG
jgi:two-component system chemotaxis response regulator CheY